MVTIQAVRVVDEEWNQGDFPGLEGIVITGTVIDNNLQNATVFFTIPGMNGDHEASVCTHEAVWSCEFSYDLDDDLDENDLPFDEEELGLALLRFGDDHLGMYS